MNFFMTGQEKGDLLVQVTMFDSSYFIFFVNTITKDV